MVSVVAEVETSRAGAVLTITLNRPDVLNALNAPADAGLAAALEEARDPSVRAVVLTGAGRGFCTGQDLGELRAGVHDVAHRLIEGLNRNVLALRSLEKPVLAAVNGPAAGAGLSLALACDARIAADDATFVPGVVRVGLAPDSGATWLVRRAVGGPRAFEWLATGRALSADEARDWGLVSEVVPAHELAERAAEVAELFASMPTRAVSETKRLLDLAARAAARGGGVGPGGAREGARLHRGRRRVRGEPRARLHRRARRARPPGAARRPRRPAAVAPDRAASLAARDPALGRRHL